MLFPPKRFTFNDHVSRIKGHSPDARRRERTYRATVLQNLRIDRSAVSVGLMKVWVDSTADDRDGRHPSLFEGT